MARDTQEVDARAHIPRAKIQFAFRFRSIQIYRYSFVTLLLELLSANHIEASSHNNAAFCHVMFSVYARAFSARELLESPVKFAGLDIRNTFSFERKKDCEKLLDVVPSANYQVHASYRTHSIIGLRAPPASNKS